jgi:hypothetical protein
MASGDTKPGQRGRFLAAGPRNSAYGFQRHADAGEERPDSCNRGGGLMTASAGGRPVVRLMVVGDDQIDAEIPGAEPRRLAPRMPQSI